MGAIVDVDHVAACDLAMRRPVESTDAGREREVARLRGMERDLETVDLA